MDLLSRIIAHDIGYFSLAQSKIDAHITDKQTLQKYDSYYNIDEVFNETNMLGDNLQTCWFTFTFLK